MSIKFNNKYRIPTNRLSGFDYGSNGYYFVTICTKNRTHYFGEIKSVETHNCVSSVETHNCASLHNEMELTEIGILTQQYIIDIPNHYPFVTVDEYVVMPNHVHCLLFINPENKTEWTPNQFGPQSQNLGAIVRALKSSVKRYANQNHIDFNWQSRYHDRIIRNDKEYETIKNYINTNIKNWTNDKLNNHS